MSLDSFVCGRALIDFSKFPHYDDKKVPSTSKFIQKWVDTLGKSPSDLSETLYSTKRKIGHQESSIEESIKELKVSVLNFEVLAVPSLLGTDGFC